MLNTHSVVNNSTSSTSLTNVPASSVTSMPAHRMPDWLQVSLLLGGLLLCRQAAVSSLMLTHSKPKQAQAQMFLPMRQLTPHVPIARPDMREDERSIAAQTAADTRPNRCTRLPIATMGEGYGDFEFTIVHNSRSHHLSELGSGWTHSLDITGEFEPQAKAIRLHWGDDSVSTFRPVKTPQGLIGKAVSTSDSLKIDSDGTFTITRVGGIRYHLDHRLCCDRIRNASGHTLTMERNLFGCVTRARDGEGHELRFRYVGGNHLMAIQDESGRRWLLNFAPRQQTLDLTEILTEPVKGTATCTHIAYDVDGNIAVVGN